MNKINNICFGVIALFFSFAALASAEVAPPLTPEQENMIASMISEVESDPIQFVLKVQLSPPKTQFSLEIKEEQYKRTQTEESALYNSGLIASGDFEQDIPWNADISCGTFTNTTPPNRYVRVWNHPEGPKPNCFHENTTSHRGTVSVTGTYTRKVYPKEKVVPVYYEAVWRVHCTYEGSETGRAECTETPISMKGVDGKERIEQSPPPESILDDTSEAENTTKNIGLGLAAAILVGAALFWQRRKKIP